MSAADAAAAALSAPPGARRRGAPPPHGRQIWHEDDRGHRHGPALRWHPDGQNLRSLTDYAEGQRQGRHVLWYPSGAVELEGQYADDAEVGLWRRYGEDGTLLIEVPCIAGMPGGACRSFYPDGALARAWTARRGHEEGTATVYLPDGTRFSEETLRGGLREGVRRVWLAGQLLLEDHWQGGVLHGPHRAWGFGDVLLEEGAFAEGERHGRWRLYDYAGEVRAEGDYDRGVPVGGWEPPASLALPAPPAPEVPAAPALRGSDGSAPVPATLITGFLGSGKTTTILHLLASRPPGERWVVYVNEYGEVGVDGALIPASAAGEGLFVRELAGGCACCSSNLPFVEGVLAAIDQLQPDHLLLEPTGLADAEALRDSLHDRLGERLELRATLCLVDPRRLRDPRYVEQPAFMAQVRAGDVLIASRCDLASPADMDAFRRLAAAEGANKRAVLEIEQGRVDLDWLAHTSAPTSPAAPRHHHHTDHTDAVQGRGLLLGAAPADRAALSEGLSAVLADRAVFPQGWLRVKGVFRLAEGGWWVVNADQDDAGAVRLEWRPAVDGTTGESRLECLAPSGAEVDWAGLTARLRSAAQAR